MEKYRYPRNFYYYSSYYYHQWFKEEILPRYYCCERSDLCDLYTQWRPTQGCWRYRPPIWVWFWGDPHIRTLDGAQYSFNGLGEYTMALIEDKSEQRQFELQARTQQALNSKTGKLSDATFFSGFAAEYVGDARIEVKLNNDATDLITKVDGDVVTPTADGLTIGNFTVMREEDPIKVTAIFQSDIQLTFGVNNSFADVTVQLGQDYKGQTKGLLGVWDDDPSNDFLRHDGTKQTATGPSGKMTEKNHFDFGETWRIEKENSLFYYVSPESYSRANHPTFVPKFLDELKAQADEDTLREATQACGDNSVCLYDALATGNAEVGVVSMIVDETNTEDMAAAINFPPNFTNVESIEVVVGKMYTLQLVAVDPDGDDVTFQLLEDIQNAFITSSDGLFTWTPLDRSKVTLGFLATDGKANATLEPLVKLCDCQNGGTCLYDEFADNTVIIDDKFTLVLCDCMPGWFGDFCEEDFDACEGSPCFMGVACFDDQPPSMNSTCGPCPDGLEGDGKICIDIDECDLYSNQTASGGGLGCDQICENLVGSFNCSCNSGYTLFVDDKRCIDIDECNLKSDDCPDDAVCNNTQGGFECLCGPGFNDTLGDGSFCLDIDECDGAHDCASIATCENTEGSFRCVCPEGYEGSGRVCKDINECTRNLHNCHTEATCTNDVGSFNCTCNEGWSGDGTSCSNRDECSETPPVCHTNAACTDTIGSFACRCNAGYKGDGFTCDDINECDLKIDGCLQECLNTNGSFTCGCNAEFVMRSGICVANTGCSPATTCIKGDCYSDGTDKCLCNSGYQIIGTDPTVCKDINECTPPGKHLCKASSKCSNIDGGHNCTCADGYTLNNDKRSCSDINECQLPADNPSFPNCHARAVCNNIEGSVQCNCTDGFKGDGTLCENIDECESGSAVCKTSATCQDNEGSYVCVCDAGFRGDGFVSCDNIDECEENPDICPDQATCTDTNGNYTCTCNEGYQDNNDGTACEDVDECKTSLDKCAAGRAECSNNEGSYSCSCNNGYVSAEGKLPGRECDDIDECALNLDTCDMSVSKCNNNDGGLSCDCRSGFRNSGGHCVDVNECEENPSRCASKANSVCTNLQGSAECICAVRFFEKNSKCEAAVSYKASAIFEIINGLLVDSADFDITTGFATYRKQLKEDFEKAFRSSSLASSLGDVVITSLTQATESTALLKLVLNFLTEQEEPAIIQAFLSQLTGGRVGQLGSNHGLIRKSFFIGDPKCDTKPCMNSGTCSEDNSVPVGYTCSCPAGYSGQDCQTTPCDANPCSSDGTCSINSTVGAGYTCSCAHGYSGRQCQTIVPCDLGNVCTNRATCVNDLGRSARGYICSCLDGYSGDNCEIKDCSLSAKSCANGGTFDDTNCECVCPLTHAGQRCSDSNPCTDNPESQCSDSSRYCLPADAAPGFTCECRAFEGLFNVSGECQSLASLIVSMTLPDEKYVDAYSNPTSAAFKETAALYERLVKEKLERGSKPISSVSVIAIEEGSTVPYFALGFEGEAPSTSDVMKVLGKDNSFTDGKITIKIKPGSIFVKSTTGCSADYCENDGRCERSGYYFPDVNYTCSCQAQFTGERCEIKVTDTSEGGLSTLDIVFIAVGSVCFLMLVCGFILYILLVVRPRSKVEPRSSTPSDEDEEDQERINMVPLKQDVSQPPFMEQGEPSSQEKDDQPHDAPNDDVHSGTLPGGLEII